MARGALEGVKVADFTSVLAGPLITKHLADYGATVVKVESSQAPDALRTASPFKDACPGLNRSGYFAYFNSNKYSLSLNLNHPKALEVARKLILWADVVAENFRPGVMEKWGLSYEDISRVKPDIIMIRSSNQGQTGPYKKQPGLGTHLNALAGLISVTGWPDCEPVNMMLAYTDYVTPFLGAAALIAALDYRRKTGKGQLLDLSQLECGLQFFLPAILDYSINNKEMTKIGNSCAYAAPHGAYRCKGDDRWCAMAVFTDEEWGAFCQVIGNPPWTRQDKFSSLLARKKNENELNRLIEEWTMNFTAEQVMQMMQAAGIAAGVVNPPKDVFEDSQLRKRSFFWLLNHPEIGPFHHLGQTSKLSKTPAEPRMPAPCIGEHSEFVCKTFLEMSEDDIDELLVDNVFE